MSSKWIFPALAAFGIASAQEPTPTPERMQRETVMQVKPETGKCVIPIKNLMPKNNFSRMPQVPAPTEIDPKFVKEPPLPICVDIDHSRKLSSVSPANPPNRFPKLRILPR